MNKKQKKQSPAARGAAAPSVTIPPVSPAEVETIPHSVDRSSASVGGGLAVLAAGLFVVALAIALYLVRLAVLGGTAAGCGPESGCGEVLKSRWSSVVGLPVSLFGAGLYAFLLFSALFLWPATRGQRRLEGMASVMVLGGALWFTVVQAFILKAFCPWCCTAHGLASIGVVLLWRARRARPSALPADPAALGYVALALVAVAGLAIVQSATPPPERIQQSSVAHSVVVAPGRVSLHDGRVTLDPATLPVIGLPEATTTTVALTDFTCPHCRELHRTLSQLADQRPGQFNTVLLPGAFEPGAREIHRIMLALWRIDPARYREMAEGLVQGAVNPTAQEVLERVQPALGGRFYELAWPHAGWVQQTLDLGEELLALNRSEAAAATLPQLMIGNRVLTGAPHADTLVPLLEAAAEAGAAAPVSVAVATTAAPPAPPAAAPADASTPPATAAATPAATATGADPVIDFGSTMVELGQVTKGDSVTKKITFTNTGGSPLTLKNIKAGCGCTTIQGWQQTVAPGQQGAFEIKLDTTNFAGVVTKTVDVESNASNGTIKLFLKADIWAPVRLSSSSVSFGNVLKGTKPAPREIEVTVTDAEPLKLGEVTTSNPYFQVELKPLEEGRRYQLTVAVPELGERPQNAELILNLGHPKLKQMKLSAYINPVDPLMVQPKQLNVSSSVLAAGTTATVTVFCHDPEVPSLEVTDLAYSGGGGVEVSFEKKPSDRWGRVLLKFPAGYVPPQASGTFLTFRTSHPRHPEVKVPVQFPSPRPAPAPAAVPAAVPAGLPR